MLRNEARMKQPQKPGSAGAGAVPERIVSRRRASVGPAVMMDLERVLPSGVQVMSIDPSISKEGDVNIRLRVNGDREKGRATGAEP